MTIDAKHMATGETKLVWRTQKPYAPSVHFNDLSDWPADPLLGRRGFGRRHPYQTCKDDYWLPDAPTQEGQRWQNVPEKYQKVVGEKYQEISGKEYQERA